MAGLPVPEIIRVPLESMSLAVKAMQAEEDVCSLFAPCGCRKVFVFWFFLSRAIDLYGATSFLAVNFMIGILYLCKLQW